MPVSARGYASLDDLSAMVGLMSTRPSRVSPAGALWYPGNAVWNLYTGMQGIDPRHETDRIRLWCDDTDLIGLVVDLGSGDMYVDSRPEEGSGGAVWVEALAWAEAWAAASGGATCSLAALESDGPRRARLETAGYVIDGAGHPRMRLDLGARPPEPDLPAGMRFHDCADVDLEERAAAHRDAWEHLEHIGIEGARSAFSREVYERLRAAPGYDVSLDFVVQDRNGTIAASCICWADENSETALFEPVGTRAAYRRRGLGRALVLGALGRLRERGMRTALVGTSRINAPAVRTYLGCGFEIVDHELTYTKALG